MINKIVIVSVFLMSLAACNLIGQQRKMPSAKDMAERQTEMMTKNLDLSEKQQKAISTINLKYAEEIQKIRQEAAGDREKMRKLRDDLVINKNDELKGILSSEQFEKYKKLEEERAKEMRNGRRGGRGGR
jgi:Skp family chaperone for outer membrane proteins